MSDVNSLVVEPLTKFVQDSAHLVKKCSKPDRRGKLKPIPLLALVILKTCTTEFARIARATGIGFLIMGFVGFFVKLVHIPINNILVGGI